LWIARISFFQGSWTEKKKATKVNDIFCFYIINLSLRKDSTFEIIRWSKEAPFSHHVGCQVLICKHFVRIHLWMSQIFPFNLFCCKKTTFLAIFLTSICCTWICFHLIFIEYRVDGFIYDGNEVDLDASKDADFSMEPCSKSKKKSLKKVEILHIYAEVSVYSFTL